jgi:hypothetical protein
VRLWRCGLSGSASGAKVFGDCNPCHDGLERMLVYIGDSGRRLTRQPVHIPKLGRGCMGVEQIIDADRGTPAPRKCIVSVKIPFAEALAVNLAERGCSWGVRARSAEIVLCG